MLEGNRITGGTAVGCESQVKLGRTFHPVKIAAVGRCYKCIIYKNECKSVMLLRNTKRDGGVREEILSRRLHTILCGQ